VLWELRYRGLKDTDNGGVKGVHDVLLETDGDTEAEAHEVAEYYLSTLNNPSTRFIFVRPAVAMTTRRMKAAKRANGAPSDESGDEATPPRSAKTATTPGRIGA